MSKDNLDGCDDITLISAFFLLKVSGQSSTITGTYAVLASGQSSTITGTYAGQYIMQNIKYIYIFKIYWNTYKI
ncbi:hypothetical protein DCAR_0102389 [Daucus carota subsp. sativus]|uniref:Uncharacterized protein n=1 Tax=Daucus carota subsp. sativus TaxID=79200 RepID=A0AAF0W8C5_DAUCS|nr:hypothetical protein DCAR_0102389 [Daucus carota subsp. sativus]